MKNYYQVILFLLGCLFSYQMEAQVILLENDNGGNSEFELSFPSISRTQLKYSGPGTHVLLDLNISDRIARFESDFGLTVECAPDNTDRTITQSCVDEATDDAFLEVCDMPNRCVEHRGLNLTSGTPFVLTHKYDRVQLLNPIDQQDRCTFEYDAQSRMTHECVDDAGETMKTIWDPTHKTMEVESGNFRVGANVDPNEPGPAITMEEDGTFHEHVIRSEPPTPSGKPVLRIFADDHSSGLPLRASQDILLEGADLILTNPGNILQSGVLRVASDILLIEPRGSLFVPIELNPIELRVTGDLFATGDVNANGTKNFRIDHPLDPDNKFLQHAAIEAPKAINYYDGLVMTDKKGYATVSMPDYFRAINKDFRYQLTIISKTFAQAIVWEEINDKGQFIIKSDVPNLKVSWVVSATRNDTYMKEHPFVIEGPK